MTIETETLRADLRALMASPQLGVPDSRADPMVQRRVGRMLVERWLRIYAARAAAAVFVTPLGDA